MTSDRSLSVCVVGGTRFFGARVVRLLLTAGHRVTLLTRGTSPDDHGSTVERLRGDANDTTSLAAALAGRHFDVVIHQMIYSPVSAIAAAQAFDGHTDRLIMTSTIEVYADGAGGRVAPAGGWRESDLDPTASAFDASLPWTEAAFAGANYGRGKREAEAALVSRAGFPVTIVRVGHVLAAREFTGRLDWFADRVRSGDDIVDGARSSFVHAADIARFFAWLAENPLTGVVNAASDPALTPRAIGAALQATIGREARSGASTGPSPFSYATPFAMSMDRSRDAGFAFRPSGEWLRELAVEVSVQAVVQ